MKNEKSVVPERIKTLNSLGEGHSKHRALICQDLYSVRHLITGLNRNIKRLLLPLFYGPKILFVLQASKTRKDNDSYIEITTCL